MKKIYERVQGTVEIITIVMHGVVVHSVYKPPNDLFELPALGHRYLPHIVIGDFKSHSTTWGYTSTDNEGEASGRTVGRFLRLSLIHDAKLPKQFYSARWKKDRTQTSSSHLIASQTCVRSRSWTLSHTTPSHLC